MTEFDCQEVLGRLRAYPPSAHRLLPPCPKERLDEVEAELGRLPGALISILKCFNGAELFLRDGPLLSTFGISTAPPLPPLEWAPDWYVDKFTPKWRAAAKGREDDWVIAMMNYGALVILDNDSQTKEWETSQRIWGQKSVPFEKWLEGIFRDGDAYMRG